LQSALAADDSNAANSATTKLQSTFVSITGATLDGATKSVWLKEQEQLDQILKRLNAANDITKARAEFALLSEEMLAIVQRFHVTTIGDIYELHCPMAFEGRGATWLQANDQVKNPYYGASMLTCADRVRKLEITAKTGANKGGHQNE
jgi:Cu(I)/Ag(I) efflux system membrane fusion protein